MRFGECPTRPIEKEPTFKPHKIEKILFTFEADGVILPDEKFATTFKLSIAKSRLSRSIGDLIGAGNDRLNLNGGKNAPTTAECV